MNDKKIFLVSCPEIDGYALERATTKEFKKVEWEGEDSEVIVIYLKKLSIPPKHKCLGILEEIL
jgi:hypothetical protein